MDDDGPTAETDDAYPPERLCYGGERVIERASLGRGWAVVTTHRVLAYDPDADGRRFQAVDRPNVSDIALDASGERRYLRWGVRAAGYGVTALAGGVALRAMNLGETLSVETGTGAAPISGIIAVTDALASALVALTSLLFVGGAVGLAAGLGLLGQYLRTRNPALTIGRFGDDPVRLAVPKSAGERAATTLSAALRERRDAADDQ